MSLGVRVSLVTMLAVLGTSALRFPPLAAQTSGEPKLIVILVADQMRVDYLQRYSAKFIGGLRRLIDNGAWFERAAYPYLNTITCAGHSTIGTGTFPYQHGMFLNTWFDRKTRKLTECTDDAKAKEINYAGLTGPGDSGRRIQMPSLADVVRRKGGHVAAHAVEAEYGHAWDRLYDPSAYQGNDDDPAERAPTGWTRTFPHVIGSKSGKPDAEFYGHWMRSPFSDAYLGKFAAAGADELHLGKGPHVDFLGVSFSALDLVGHAYGPDSHEVQDLLAHLDVTIGELLDHLDRTVGAGNYVLGFTADHGVAQIPEEGHRGGRETNAETTAVIEKALVALLGPGKYVANAAYTDIYLEEPALKRMKKDAAVRR